MLYDCLVDDRFSQIVTVESYLRSNSSFFCNLLFHVLKVETVHRYRNFSIFSFPVCNNGQHRLDEV